MCLYLWQSSVTLGWLFGWHWISTSVTSSGDGVQLLWWRKNSRVVSTMVDQVHRNLRNVSHAEESRKQKSLHFPVPSAAYGRGVFEWIRLTGITVEYLWRLVLPVTSALCFGDSCWQCLLFLFWFFKCLFLFVCECGSCFVCWSHNLFELELFVKMLIAMYILRFSGWYARWKVCQLSKCCFPMAFWKCWWCCQLHNSKSWFTREARTGDQEISLMLGCLRVRC